MMNSSHNYRFIERDYWYQQALCNSELLSPSQVEDMLDQDQPHYCDYTFKFYEDGSVQIINNDTNERVHPRSLTGAVLDFYIRKRIHLIKVNLQEKQLQYAQ
jgi:sulfur relay (sulfurtransferase) DsrF/TusC family protein